MRQCWSTYFEYFKDSHLALFLTKSEVFYVNILLRHYSFERFLYSHLIFDNLTFSGTWPASGIYPKTKCTIALGEISKWKFYFIIFFFHIKLNRMYWQRENVLIIFICIFMAPYKIYDDCHNSVGTEKKLWWVFLLWSQWKYIN